MEQTNSRWFFIFVVMSLISIFLFPPRAHADSNWLKYFRKDSLLNTYKTSYAVLDDSVWTGTFGDGLQVYDGSRTLNFTNRSTRTSPSIDDGLVSDYITCISIDEKSGRVWLGTNAGLSSCDLEGREWQRFTEKDGLPNDVIRDLAIDSYGNLWVGTPSGLAFFDGETWKTYDENNGLPQASIHSIKVKGDTIWVGSVGGTVARFKDGEWKAVITF